MFRRSISSWVISTSHFIKSKWSLIIPWQMNGGTPVKFTDTYLTRLSKFPGCIFRSFDKPIILHFQLKSRSVRDLIGNILLAAGVCGVFWVSICCVSTVLLDDMCAIPAGPRNGLFDRFGLFSLDLHRFQESAPHLSSIFRGSFGRRNYFRGDDGTVY